MSATAHSAEADRPLSVLAKLRLIVEVAVTYARARWGLTRHDLPTTLAALRARGPREGSRVPPGADRARGLRYARAVSRALPVLPADSRCLMRSLVLTALLARRGIGSSLVIGVRPGSTLAAHAWVELEGEPLLPTGDGSYERLVEL